MLTGCISFSNYAPPTLRRYISMLPYGSRPGFGCLPVPLPPKSPPISRRAFWVVCGGRRRAGAKGYLLEERSVRLCLSFATLNNLIRGKGRTTAAVRRYPVPQARFRPPPRATKKARRKRRAFHSVSSSVRIPLSSSKRDGSRLKYSTKVSIHVIESQLK